MPKGHESYKNDRKKAKLSLKEKRQLKREKRFQRDHAHDIPDTEVNNPHM